MTEEAGAAGVLVSEECDDLIGSKSSCTGGDCQIGRCCSTPYPPPDSTVKPKLLLELATTLILSISIRRLPVPPDSNIGSSHTTRVLLPHWSLFFFDLLLLLLLRQKNSRNDSNPTLLLELFLLLLLLLQADVTYTDVSMVTSSLTTPHNQRTRSSTATFYGDRNMTRSNKQTQGSRSSSSNHKKIAPPRFFSTTKPSNYMRFESSLKLLHHPHPTVFFPSSLPPTALVFKNFY